MDTFYASFEKKQTNHFFAIYQFKFNANMTDSTAYSCNGVIFIYDMRNYLRDKIKWYFHLTENANFMPKKIMIYK